MEHENVDFMVVIERLVRIETKVDALKGTEKAVSEHSDRIVKLEAASKSHQHQLDELKEKSRWAQRTTWGAIITAAVGLAFAIIRLGVGL